jgi:hypothetical protein
VTSIPQSLSSLKNVKREASKTGMESGIGLNGELLFAALHEGNGSYEKKGMGKKN